PQPAGPCCAGEVVAIRSGGAGAPSRCASRSFRDAERTPWSFPFRGVSRNAKGPTRRPCGPRKAVGWSAPVVSRGDSLLYEVHEKAARRGDRYGADFFRAAAHAFAGARRLQPPARRSAIEPHTSIV